MAKKQKRKTSDEDAGLPFFKFFIQKWILGDIRFCSIEAQGLFINICVLYWGKRCDLSYDQIVKSYPKKYQKFIEELKSQKVLKISEGKISISFLDEQLKECNEQSEINREIALEAWKQRKSNATALPPHSERDANAMPQDKDEDKDKDKDEDKDKSLGGGLEPNYEIVAEDQVQEPIKLTAKAANHWAAEFSDYEQWTEDVIQGNDILFPTMLKNEGLILNGALSDYAKSYLKLLAEYPKKAPPDQHRFRVALIGHIRENYNKVKNEQAKGIFGSSSAKVTGTKYTGLKKN